MTVYDLAKELSEMYENADKGDKIAMIHLFGIRYAKVIKEKKLSAGEIVKNTKLKNGEKFKKSYITEISKGMRLAKFVTEKQ